MNKYKYIICIIIGILLFLLWNRMNGFSIGVQVGTEGQPCRQTGEECDEPHLSCIDDKCINDMLTLEDMTISRGLSTTFNQSNELYMYNPMVDIRPANVNFMSRTLDELKQHIIYLGYYQKLSSSKSTSMFGGVGIWESRHFFLQWNDTNQMFDLIYAIVSSTLNSIGMQPSWVDRNPADISILETGGYVTSILEIKKTLPLRAYTAKILFQEGKPNGTETDKYLTIYPEGREPLVIYSDNIGTVLEPISQLKKILTYVNLKIQPDQRCSTGGGDLSTYRSSFEGGVPPGHIWSGVRPAGGGGGGGGGGGAVGGGGGGGGGGAVGGGGGGADLWRWRGGGCNDLPAPRGSPSFGDIWNDGNAGCSSYEEHDDWCDKFGGNNYGIRGNANTHCCVCGGGDHPADGGGDTPVPDKSYYLLLPGGNFEWGTGRSDGVASWQTVIENKIQQDPNAEFLYDTRNGDWSKEYKYPPCIKESSTNLCSDGLPESRNYPRSVYSLYYILTRRYIMDDKPNRSIVIYATSNGAAILFYVLAGIAKSRSELLRKIRTIFMFDPAYVSGSPLFYTNPSDNLFIDYANSNNNGEASTFNFLNGINIILFNATIDHMRTTSAMTKYMSVPGIIIGPGIGSYKINRDIMGLNHSGDNPDNTYTQPQQLLFWENVYTYIEAGYTGLDNLQSLQF